MLRSKFFTFITVTNGRETLRLFVVVAVVYLSILLTFAAINWLWDRGCWTLCSLNILFPFVAIKLIRFFSSCSYVSNHWLITTGNECHWVESQIELSFQRWIRYLFFLKLSFSHLFIYLFRCFTPFTHTPFYIRLNSDGLPKSNIDKARKLWAQRSQIQLKH